MKSRVLIIRLSSLGDVILATSAVEALARDLPGTKPDILTKPEFAGVFEGNPHVGEVVLWDKGESVQGMARRLAGKEYGYIADLHGNLRTRLLRLFLRGEWAVYRKGSLKRRLAVWFGARGLIKDAPHVTERYAAAFRPLGVKGFAGPRLYPSASHLNAARAALMASGWDGKSPPVAFAPLATWKTKAWPGSKWRELAARAIGEKSVFPVWMGGPSEKEREACTSLAEGMPGTVLAGKASLLESAAALSLSRCLVTNDSAPLHMAVAMGTPVIALFGPTVREFGFWPRGGNDVVLETDLPCRPCRLHGGGKCPRGHFKCMEEIGAERVFGAMAGFLGEA